MGTFDKVKKIVVDQLGVNEADVQMTPLLLMIWVRILWIS